MFNLSILYVHNPLKKSNTKTEPFAKPLIGPGGGILLVLIFFSPKFQTLMTLKSYYFYNLDQPRPCWPG